MDKKIVLVTGSSRGIGASCIKKFAKEGYDVVINYNNSENDANCLKREIEERYHVRVLCIKCDVSNEVEVIDMVDSIIKEFGCIDVLVNNAAIEEGCNFYEKNKESFLRVIETNLIGTFLVSKEVSRYMLKEKKGSIINISSDNSTNRFDPYTLEYDCSKAGINVLTKNLAKEFAPYIRVNAVLPGWILTDKNKELNDRLDGKFVEEESKNLLLGRFASEEEVANVVYFLGSEDSSYINGSLIEVTGGYLC